MFHLPLLNKNTLIQRENMVIPLANNQHYNDQVTKLFLTPRLCSHNIYMEDI